MRHLNYPIDIVDKVVRAYRQTNRSDNNKVNRPRAKFLGFNIPLLRRQKDRRSSQRESKRNFPSGLSGTRFEYSRPRSITHRFYGVRSMEY